MSNTQLANDIISLVGGVENISSMTHCVTRLRFALKSNDKADVEQIKKLDGVISVLNSGDEKISLMPCTFLMSCDW